MSERDRELDALWRRHSTETPPAALDDAIRAAAHRAVHAKPSAAPRARAPWPAWATFAAAASIGAIAIGVWQLQPRDIDETKVVASDTPTHSAARQEIAKPSVAQPAGPTPSAPAAFAPAPPALPVPPAPAATPSRSVFSPSPSVSAPAANAPVASARQDAAPPPSRAQAPGDRAPAVRSATDKTVSAETDTREDARKPTPFPPARHTREESSAANAEAQIARSTPSTVAAASGAQEERTLNAQAEARGNVAKVAPDTANESVAPPASAAANDTTRAIPVPNVARSRMAQAPMAMKRSGDAATAEAGALPSQAGGFGASAPREKGARTVDDFVDAIRRALAEHRDADAVSALAAMRTQFADADTRLPADLHAWAARVPRAN
jgi:hypothetical protein